MSWYRKIVDDLSTIPLFVAHYDAEIQKSKNDVRIYGIVEKNIKDLPGIVEHRYNQLQEIEAVLRFLNLQRARELKKHFKAFLENYNRALTAKEAERYAEAEDDVYNYDMLINEIALIRNQYLGIIKALDSKNYQLNNVVKLRAAGLDDIVL